MLTSERRQLPRTAIDRLAYIHIEPNNGGIILNVSEGGLCFHSIAPVQKDGQMLFSILEHNRRIDARGELVWTDEIHKVAGLRFTTLTSDAREQVQTWLSHTCISEPEASKEPAKRPDMGSPILRTIPDFRRQKLDREPRKASSYTTHLMKLRMRFELAGFSAGLATGIVVSLLAISALLFSYGHRRQLGESLIRLGERMVSKSAPVTQSTASASPPQMPPTTGTHIQREISNEKPSRPETRVRAHDFDDEPDVVQIPLPKPKATVLDSATGGVRSNATGAPAPQLSASTPTAVIAVPAVPLQPAGSTRTAENVTASVATANHGPGSALHLPDLPEHGAENPAEMYFDLGKFKDELLARNASGKVAKLGLPTSVTQKGHLWMNSYRVIVGPFTNEEEADRARHILQSHGYEQKPLERGSRNFFFSSRVMLNGTPLPQGEVTISWESFVRDAKVKFVEGNDIVASADGHWISSSRKYSQDEFVYLKTADDSRPLLEIHFYGWNRVLVLRNASADVIGTLGVSAPPS